MIYSKTENSASDKYFNIFVLDENEEIFSKFPFKIFTKQKTFCFVGTLFSVFYFWEGSNNLWLKIHSCNFNVEKTQKYSGKVNKAISLSALGLVIIQVSNAQSTFH